MMKYSKNTWSEIEDIMHTSCIKKDDTGQFIQQIYQELWNELWYLPSRNYPHSTFTLINEVPPYPLYESCQGFKNISTDSNYKLLAQNRANWPKNATEKSFEQPKLTERQK